MSQGPLSPQHKKEREAEIIARVLCEPLLALGRDERAARSAPPSLDLIDRPCHPGFGTLVHVERAHREAYFGGHQTTLVRVGVVMGFSQGFWGLIIMKGLRCGGGMLFKNYIVLNFDNYAAVLFLLTMKSVSLYRRLGLLAVGFLLPGAAANPFAQQQYLVGSEAPHGYSNDDYRKEINVPTKAQSRILPTVDVTDPSYPNSPMNGWGLGVKISQNVPFPKGNLQSDGGSKVFDAATLFLTPSRRELAEALRDWFLCSAVWTNGLSEAALAGATGERGTGYDSCRGMLSDECVSEMIGGFNSANFCQNQTMPRACAPFLANGTDGVTRGSNLPQSEFFPSHTSWHVHGLLHGYRKVEC
jgi:hypothetical protein